jgi:hypothetical protein
LRPVDGKPSALGGAEVGKLLDALATEMSRPQPRREEVARQAREAAQALGGRLSAVERSPTQSADDVQRQFDALWKERQRCDGCWDRATQCYLELAALHHAVTDLDPGRRDAQVVEELKAMAARLRFPAGVDSPGAGPPFLTAPKKGEKRP